MKAFSLIYLLTLGIVYIFSIPILLLLSFKSKYKHSIFKRFFLYKNPPFKDDCVWFHGCSLGEVKSFTPFAKELDIFISTTTQTGFSEAKKLSKNVRYLPFEIFLPFWIKKPKMLIVSEAELWYMLFLIAKLKGAKTFLINARISDKSVNSYQKFSWFYKKIFENIDFVFAQSEVDKKRLESLGVKNVVVNGNIKTAIIPSISKSYQKPNRRVITIASSHENEEEQILSNINLEKNDMLIIAPRHPERFTHVKNLALEFANKNSLVCKNFSESGFCECDILVCDCLGELINIYAITDITLLCGSFVPNIGGHNPLECAVFENIIISGKHYFNQKELYKITQNIYEANFNDLKRLLKQDLKKSKMKDMDAINPILNQIRKIL